MTQPPASIWPSLRARDAHALIRFLIEVIGFEETVVYGDDERVDHAQLNWPEGGGVMLGSAKNSDDDPWGLQPGTFGCYVVTDRIDELFERAKRAGADVVDPPRHDDYGSYSLRVRDPEGNRWSFGTYRGEPHRTQESDQPNAVERFLDASRRGDLDAALGELAPDVVMLNPDTDNLVIGERAVADAMRVLESACDTFRHSHLLIEPTGTVNRLYGLVFEATIGKATLRGVDLIQIDDDDRICRFEVAARPLEALMALGARTASQRK